MEELGVDEETVKAQEAEEAEQERRRRHRNRKKPAQLARQRTESEIREELGLNDMGATLRVLGVLALVFGVMAGLGGLMSVLSTSNNKALAMQVQEQQNLNVNVAKEVFVLACETTWQATKLWARLLVAVILPTSHTTFRITKDGFSAMQPSLSASAHFVAALHWTTKAALAAAGALVTAAWLLQREIKRRKYFERLQAWQARRQKAIADAYESVASRVRKQSRVLADLLPHVLFVAAAAVGYAVGRKQFVEFARGLGGWAVVIGLPVLMATRALIVYDMAYRAKLEQIYGTRRRRTFSELPTAESAARASGRGWSLSSWLPGFLGGGSSSSSNRRSSARRSVRGGQSRLSVSRLRRSVGRGAPDDSEDDASSITSLDSTEVSTTPDGLHYPRQLEDDPVASLEQYEELQSVVYWLQYWTVLGVALLFEQLPISGHLLAALPLWPPLRLLWALWLQVPGTAGAALSFRFVVPIVDKLLGRVEGSSGAGVSAEQQNLLVNVLFAFRIISADTRLKLAEALETGGTLLVLGFVFFIMPSTITGVGALIIGLGRPVVSASRALLAMSRAEKLTRAAASPKADASAKRRFRSNSVSISYGAVQSTAWLEYFVVYTVSMLAHGLLSVFLFWFPLWNHLLLVFTLWLQLPYFRGAHNTFKVALAGFYRVRAVVVSVKEKDKDGGKEASPSSASEGGKRDSSKRTSSKRVSSKRTSSKRGSARHSAARAPLPVEADGDDDEGLIDAESEARRRLSAQSRRSSGRAEREAARLQAERERVARIAEAEMREQQRMERAQQTASWVAWMFGFGGSGAVNEEKEGDAAAAKEVSSVPQQYQEQQDDAGDGAESSAGDSDAEAAAAAEAVAAAAEAEDEEEALLRATLEDYRDEDGEPLLAGARDSVGSNSSAESGQRRQHRRASRKKAKLNRKLLSSGGTSSSSLASAARAQAEEEEEAAAAAAAAQREKDAVQSASGGGGLFAWFGGGSK